MLVFSGGLDFAKTCDSFDLSEKEKEENVNTLSVDGQFKCLSKYNTDLDKVRELLIAAVYTLRALSFLFCALSFKWRRIANVLLYLECLERVVNSLIPLYIKEGKSNASYLQEYFLVFVIMYSDARWHIFALVAAYAFAVFVPQSLVYLVPLTVAQIAINCLLAVLLGVGCTCIAMIAVYIS